MGVAGTRVVPGAGLGGGSHVHEFTATGTPVGAGFYAYGY